MEQTNGRKNGNKNGTKKQKQRGVLKHVLLGCTLLCLSFMLFAAVFVLKLDAWNEFDPGKILDASECLILYDKDGKELSCLYGAQKVIRIPVSLSAVPAHVKNALIAAEDARFYEHIGVDFIRILGAAWADIKAGAYVQGASTLSQQLVKLSHLTNEKVLSRKLEEAVLAYQMEQQFSKDEILEMYLNYVYFGGGYYGIEAAARGHFGVSAGELTVAQGAQLIGILKAPSRYAPHLNMENSISRRNLILELMEEYGYLDDDEVLAAKAEPVTLSSNIPEDERNYYIDEALRQACATLDVSMDELLTGGYRIYTGMDTALQAHAQTVLLDETCFPQGAEDAQAALVAINAQNGTVAAMMGGRKNTTALAFNRAVRIKRQPGSVIKPIIAYAPALEEKGYTTVSMVLDERTNFDGYAPDNFGDKYYGWVTLREAVLRSLNVPAVKVLSDIGVDKGMAFAKKLGITFAPEDRSLALALGGFTYGVSPMEIAGAYAAIAAQGAYSTPALNTKITDARGEVIYEYQPERTRVMSEGNAYILTSMLQSTIEEGTGRRLNDLSMQLAGKTGTNGLPNGGNRDAWMAAYNPEYSIAVWMGYDDDLSGALPNDATGGTYPALIIKSLFQYLYEDMAAPVFSMPDSVREYRLDGYTLNNQHVAVLANGLTPDKEVVREVFVAGTEPTDMSQYWIVPAPPSNISARLDPSGRPVIAFEPPEAFILYRLYREGADGTTVQLGEWPGSGGGITFTDEAAQPGDAYSYYVVGVHPQLVIAGKQVMGAASRRVTIVMPEEGANARAEHNVFQFPVFSSGGRVARAA